MALESKKVTLGLASAMIADAAFNAVAKQWVKNDLDHLRFPEDLRFVFPLIKTGSAVGLVAGVRWSGLGRLTAVALIGYFLAAMGFHARARDGLLRYVPAAAMLTWSVLALRACSGCGACGAEGS